MLAQAEVEEEMSRLSDLLEKVVHEIKDRSFALVDAEEAYQNARRRAYLKTEGTVAEREAITELEVQELWRAYRIAQVRLDAAKQAGTNYRAASENMRSINANLRALVVGS